MLTNSTYIAMSVRFALLAIVVLLVVGSTNGLNCFAQYCSCRYKYQKKSGGNWNNELNDGGSMQYWCVQVWGSKPLDTYGGGSGDNTRIKRDGRCSSKKCKKRTFGNVKCHSDSWAWFADLYKCY